LRARLVAPLLLAVALTAAGCGTGGPVKTGDVTKGKALFLGKGQCAGCHALAAAGSVSNVGPNLDDAFAAARTPKNSKLGQDMYFSESTIRNLVLDQIRVAAPPMPRNLVTGQDAADVAAFVASVAGVKTSGATAAPPAGGTSSGGGTTTGGGAGTTGGGTGTAGGSASDGKSIFTANCGACHTLAAAGTTGNVGPNLDKLNPDEARVKRQVENGGAIMPAFKGKLTDAQIAAVAKFVASAAGKK
jgi:mono/diheme cytochrome c family protein